MIDKTKIIRALRITWDVIGPEILQLTEQDSISKDDVIEAVCDADYVVTHGGLTLEEWREFQSQDDLVKIPVLLDAFPCEEYGW